MSTPEEVAAQRAEAAARNRPTLEGARQHMDLVRIRKIHDEFQQVADQAEAEGIDVPTKLKNLGFDQPEDFYLSCPRFKVTERSRNLGELGSGYVCFFDLFKCVGVLLVFCLAVNIFVMFKAYGVNDAEETIAKRTWIDLAAYNDNAADCRKCLLAPDSPPIEEALQKPAGITNYGLEGCKVYDYSEPNDQGTCRTNFDPSGGTYKTTCIGSWCCKAWCYVSMDCPTKLRKSLGVQASTLTTKYLVNYRANGCNNAPADISATCVAKYNRTQAEQNCPDFSAKPCGRDLEIIDASWKTPGSVGHRKLESYWPIGMFALIFLVSMIGMTVYGERQKSVNEYVDAAITSPNDYAILVRGLPTEGKEGTDEEEIKQFFEDHALAGSKKPEIVKVVIGWDMIQYNEFKAERMEIVKQIAQFQKAGYDADHPQILNLRVKIGDITKKLLSVAQDVTTIMKSSGAAVVIFRRQGDQRECLKRWDSFAVQTLTFFAIPHTLPQYKGKYTLNVIRAPNPTDIRWEDLAQSRKERWKRVLITWAVMFIVLVLAGVGFYFLEQWRHDNRESQRVCECSEEKKSTCIGKWPSRLIGVLIPFLTAMINGVLMMVARLLAVKEYHDSVADKESSLIWKISLVLVFNTVLMQYVVRSTPAEWYLSDGLVFDVMLLLIFNALLSPIMLLFDVGFRVKQKLVKRIDIETTKLPKEKYYKYYEPSELNIPRQYAVMIKGLTLSTFYMPLLPWAPALGAIGIILQYWAVKYMVVRKFKRPVATAGVSSASTALKAVSVYVLFSVTIGHYIFLRESYPETGGPSTLLLILFIFAIFASLAAVIIPDFIRRFLCGAALCYGTRDVADTANEADFYDAQYLWPKDRKYNKVQPLYRNLPEKLNPTNFENNDALKQEDLQGNIAGAFAEIAKEEEEKDETGDVVPGWQFMAAPNRTKVAATQWERRSVIPGQTVTAPDGQQAIVAAPPLVTTQSGTPVIVALVENQGHGVGATNVNSPGGRNEYRHVQPATQRPSQPMTQQPIQPMQQPVQPITQQPVRPMMQQPVQPMMQQPVQPMMQQPVQPMTQQPVQPMQYGQAYQAQPYQAYQPANQPANQPPQQGYQGQAQQQGYQGQAQQQVQPCIGGCGRPQRSGFMKNGQPYGACCRGCARSHGHKHDHSCGQ